MRDAHSWNQAGAPDSRWRRIDRALDSRLFVALAVSLIAVATFARAMQPVGNPDTGWHIEIGRHLIETRSATSAEPFTHTARGAPMVLHEWLGQVVLAAADEIGGLHALRIGLALFAAGVFVALFALLRRLGVARVLALLGAFLYVVIAIGRFQLRPYVFNIGIGLAFYAWLFVARPALTGRQLVTYGAASVVWANIHAGGAIAFALLVSGYVAAEWAQQRLDWRTPASRDLGQGQPGRLFALAAVAWLAVFTTPAHLTLVPHLIQAAAINAGSLEWRSLVWGLLGGSGPPLAYEAFIVAFAATGVAGWIAIRRRESLAPLAVAFVAAALPMVSLRFLWIAFVPILWWMPAIDRWLRSDPSAKRGALVAIGSLGVVLLAAPPVLFPYGGPWRALDRFERGEDFYLANHPVYGMRFLRAVGLEGRLFNPAHWGGHVLYASRGQQSVFADGRWVTVGLRIKKDNQHITGHRRNALAKLDQYDIRILLVERGWTNGTDGAEDVWVPVFLGFNSAVFVRRDDRENLARVADWYDAQGIAFDPSRGFDERAAVASNPAWARAYRVGSGHLAHFGPDGAWQPEPIPVRP